MKLARLFWLAVPLLFVAALALAAGDDAPSGTGAATTAPPTVHARLASDELHGAAATLARRSPTFTARARKALKKADRALARDSARLSAALDEWLTATDAQPDAVIEAVDALRGDVRRLRRTVTRLKARGRRHKRARTYLLKALSYGERGLRGTSTALVAGDADASIDLLAPALRSFDRADAMAKKANRALGCRRPCSRAL